MPDIRVRQTIPAEFKGVQFFVRTESLPETGRRRVLHEYPNSNQRFVEDLGQIPPTFRIEAFVHGTDFLQNAAALEAVLNEETPGPISLPVLGTFQVYALPYSKNASQQSVGEIEFTLNFATGRPTAGPIAREQQIEDLYEQGDDARGLIETAFDNLFTALTAAENAVNTGFNLASTQFDTLQIADSLAAQYLPFIDTAQLSTFNSRLADVRTRGRRLFEDVTGFARALIQGDPDTPGALQVISTGVPDGSGIDTALRGINFGNELSIQSFDIIGASEESIVSPPLSSIDFSPTIEQWPADTIERQRRNSARRLLVQVYRIGSLVTAYEQAAAATFQTEEQVIAVRELLGQAHDIVIRRGINGEEAIQLDPDVRTAVNNVRFTALQILERKEQSTPGLTEININGLRSAFELSYSLYAEDFQTADSLINRAVSINRLNSRLSAVGLTGDISVFDRSTGNVV